MESKRITVINKNPNEFFKKVLKDLIDEAEAKKRRISKTYQKALDSLNRYPLYLASGHDCAILENFGPKICQLLDEKLEQHVATLKDLDQRLCFKDKLSELQSREMMKISELINSVEAACLSNNSMMPSILENTEETLNTIEEVDGEDESQEAANVSSELEISKEFNSTADSEDSLDRLLNKYDSEAAEKRKKLKRKVEATDDVATFNLNNNKIPSTATAVNSPISSVTKVQSGVRLKKFKTFDLSSKNIAGPSYASSPISNFLDVETSPAPVVASKFGNEEFNQIAVKYNFEFSPILVPEKEKVDKKKKEKVSKKDSAVIASEPVKLTHWLKPTQFPPAKEIETQNEDIEDEHEYISIDDINPNDYKIVLLVDIGETSGLVLCTFFYPCSSLKSF
jgi:hypothetical protein